MNIYSSIAIEHDRKMLIELVCLCITIVVFLAWKYWKKGSYWRDQGIKQLDYRSLLGSEGIKEVFLKRTHILEVMKEHYKQFPGEKVYGMYTMGAPSLIIKDPDLVQQIFVRDFNYFTDRDPEERLDMVFGKSREFDIYWRNQLTSLNGTRWKDVRSKFSPIFTSGKMKVMMKFIREKSKSLVKDFERIADSDKADIELKTVFGKFSMDTLASCAFGVDAECFDGQGSPFVKNAEELFRFSKTDGLMLAAASLIPGVARLYDALNINVMHPRETGFFVNVIRQTIQHRRESGVRRNDLIDMMLDAMKNDNNDNCDDSKDTLDQYDQYDRDMKMDYQSKIEGFDETTIISTAFILMVAGYDTTALTLAFAVYELTKQPELLERLTKEIDEAYEAAGDNGPDYAAIQELPYLDQCIHETIRLHPVFNMNRFITCLILP